MEDVLAFVLGQPLGLALLIAFPIAVYKQWIVPGPYFRREVESNKALRDTIAMQAEALNKNADGQELVLGVVRGIDERLNGRPNP